VSSGLPNREQALGLLHKCNCSPQVISHSIAVADIAVETASRLEVKGHKINIDLVEAGSLFHDLGRSKTHTIDHAIAGAQIAQSIGLPETVIRIIKRHVGAGITTEEAQMLGWPKDIYAPQTLEEKIVSFSDKLIDKSRRMPIETEIERLQMKNKPQAAERVRKLNDEITRLLGDKT
jgi:uncharacterized protein